VKRQAHALSALIFLLLSPLGQSVERRSISRKVQRTRDQVSRVLTKVHPILAARPVTAPTASNGTNQARVCQSVKTR
jgi:hypothetical protein